MSPLLQILQQTLVDSLAPRKSSILQRGAIGASVIALTVALSFIALIFLALAFYSWMILYVIPPIAALVTAGSLLFICLMTVSGLFLTLKAKPEASKEPDETAKAISTLAAIAGDELGKTAQTNPKTTLVLAGIAGLIAGKYMQ